MTTEDPHSAPVHNALDHIVIASKTLEQGIDYISDHLGICPQPGGQHTRIGTHNALLSLGPSCYLEVIAIDPGLPEPQRSRWFGLDQEKIKDRLSERPHLLHWVCRTNAIEQASRIAPHLFGPIEPMSRGLLKWQITIPEDGSLPLGGVVPSLIEWHSNPAPAALLPDQGLRLKTLELSTPETAQTETVLRQLQIKAEIGIRAAEETVLKAVISTPSGDIVVE